MVLLDVAMYLLFSFAFILPLFWILKRYKTAKKLPPGPWPLPIIGNLMKLGDKPHKSMAELAKIYGCFLTLKLGQLTTIVISSADIAKEILQKQDLAFSSTRFIPNAVYGNDSYKHSVEWLPATDKWRNLRKVMNLAIFSKSKLDRSQNQRRQKVHELIAYAGKCCQERVAVDIGQAAFTTSLNMLSNTIFSLDLAHLSEDSSKEFRDIVKNLMAQMGKPNLADFFPAIAKIDPQGIRRQVACLHRKILAIFIEMIDHKIELRRKGKVDENDMLDVILNIQETATQIDKSEIGHLFVDLFMAGTDTTSSTIEWAMAELLHNPTLIKKAKNELEQTIGKGKPIEETDLPSLPYLRAIVKETLRKHPPVPLLVPHTVMSDVEVCEYIVPKGAQVVVNVWAMGRDPGIWVNPMLFSPERFLCSEIDFHGQDFEFIPFGSGKRICPGLPMAIRIIPMVLGSLLNSFDWKLEDGHEKEDLDMEEIFGVTLQKAQPLRVVPSQS